MITKSFIERQFTNFYNEVIKGNYAKYGISLKPLPIAKYVKNNYIYPQNGKYAGTSTTKYSTLEYDVTNIDTIYVSLTTGAKTSDEPFVIFGDNSTNKNIVGTACVTREAKTYTHEKIDVPANATVCIVNFLNGRSAFAESIVDDSAQTPISEIKADGGYANVLRKVGIVGDSLSCGALDIQNGNSAVDNWEEYSWAKFMARRTDCELVKLAQGGLQVANWLATPFPTTARETTNKCDSYFIMLGHNDQSTLSGNIDDVNVSDLSQSGNTTYGNLGKIVGILKEANPKAKIFFITYPLYMCEYKGVNTMLREICDKVGGYLIDLYAYDKTTDYFKDVTHLTPFGYYTWATEIMTYVDYIMRNNMADFKDIGYATKDYTL